MSIISIKQLLEAGVHFGHHTRRWNPKMSEYIFTERNGIYIIDLQKTVKKFEEAYMFIRDIAAEGGNILFQNAQKVKGDEAKGDEAGFTPEQRFFLAYSNVWAGNIRDEEILQRTKNDPHSLGRWRVNGALPHINAWYEAWNVTEESPMYLAPEKRVSIW